MKVDPQAKAWQLSLTSPPVALSEDAPYAGDARGSVPDRRRSNLVFKTTFTG